MAFAAMTLASVAPEVARDIGVGTSLIGYQVALTFGSGIVTALHAGRMIGRFGACRTSQVSMVLTCAGCALIATGSLSAIVVASMVIGMAYGFTNPAASHLINRFADSTNRNLVFSIKQAGVPLGGVMAGLVAPTLTLAFGWQSVPLFVLVLLAGLIGLFELPRRQWDDDRERRGDMEREPDRSLMVIWRSRPVRWLTAGATLYVMVMLSLTGFLVTMLVEDLGFSLVSAGIVLSAVQGSAALARLGWGWLADRCRNGLRVMTWIGIMATAAAMATTLATAAWPQWLIVALFLLFGISAMGWVGVFYGSLANLSPSGKVGTVTGGALAVSYVGIIVGPTLVAGIYEIVHSYTASFAFIAAIGAVGTCAIVLARRSTVIAEH